MPIAGVANGRRFANVLVLLATLNEGVHFYGHRFSRYNRHIASPS